MCYKGAQIEAQNSRQHAKAKLDVYNSMHLKSCIDIVNSNYKICYYFFKGNCLSNDHITIYKMNTKANVLITRKSINLPGITIRITKFTTVPNIFDAVCSYWVYA